MTELYEKYAQIKIKIKSLETELEEIRPELEKKVFDDMENGQPVKTTWGEFRFTYVPKWNYSEELTMQESMAKQKIKLLKKQEENNGKAVKISDGGRLVYSMPKI